MEHLLLPGGAVIPASERAPYIAEPYDGGPFLDYPQRSRFKHLHDALLPDGDWPQYQATFDEAAVRDLEIFLQTWLFFGLLHEVFGDRAPPSAFTVKQEGEAQDLISTARLGEIIDVWVADHFNLGDEGKELLEHLIHCILRAHRMLSIARRASGLNAVHVWTITSLGETLDEVILETLDKGTRSLSTTWNAFNTDDIAEKLVDNGWCPADVRTWRASMLGFQPMYYLSKVIQPKIKDHKGCSGEVCVANQYDVNNRPTLHRCVGHDCDYFYVDDEKVMAVLADGHIALLDISIAGDDLGSLKIGVVSSKDQKTYVALSHVWAEGLGNPSGNALPRCQLAYVAEKVKSLGQVAGHTKILLWLDTLCCPVRSLPHRLLCITRMREIYRESTHVLVLDAALSHYSSQDLDSIEIWARLMYAGWMRRLWTLQEGALARSLWVQLKDVPIDLGPVETELAHIYRTKFIYSPLMTLLYSSLRRLRESISPDRSRKPSNLTQLSAAVKNRSVSVPSDEAICLCTFMGLDQENVVHAADTDRMKTFWESMHQANREIPIGIIFFTGPRLSNPGFRWAPASFLREVQFYRLHQAKQPDQIAELTPKGLRVTLPAFDIHPADMLSEADDVHWNRILKDLPSMCYIRLKKNAWFMLCESVTGGSSSGASVIEVVRRNHGRNVMLQTLAIDEMSPVFSGSNVCQGLVGCISHEDDNDIIFRAEDTLNIVRVVEGNAVVLEAAWHQSHDPVLHSLLRPFNRDPEEQPVIQNNQFLSCLPNAAVERMSELAQIAFEDLSVDSDPSSVAVGYKKTDIMEFMIIFLARRYGDIQRTWPKEQIWYLD